MTDGAGTHYIDNRPGYYIKNNSGEIFSESTFRIIPDKPNPGSTIRVVGENFGVLQFFDFYMNDNKIGNFETDANGDFITTMIIPNSQSNERVDFKAKLDSRLEITLNKTIKKVTDDIESMSFNTAVSSMMILLNEMEKIQNIRQKDYEIFLKILYSLMSILLLVIQ